MAIPAQKKPGTEADDPAPAITILAMATAFRRSNCDPLA